MKLIKAPVELAARQPWLIAVLISAGLVSWMVSGAGQSSAAPADSATAGQASGAEAPVPKVVVTDFQASQVTREITLYGRTEPDRQVTLRSEIDGRVEQLLAKRGSLVTEGQPLARIAMDDRRQQLAQAKALLKQRELEFEGARKLRSQGYQAESRLAEKEAQLKDALARVTRLEIEIANTVVRAPFAGILNERMVEVGDYVRKGDSLAEVIDIDPLVVRADATETQVTALEQGMSAEARFVDTQRADGTLRYISRVANRATNTFRIEVAIPNPGGGRIAGMSAELTIPLATERAIKVTPALLALDEQGNLGVKSVADQQVVFTPINLVKSEADGIWLGGLGDEIRLITVGAAFVRPGDRVETVHSDELELAQ